MKIFIAIIIIICPFIIFSQAAQIPVKAAVIKAQYQNMFNVLESLNIEHEVIKHINLENFQKLSEYDAIFIPCGIGASAKISINILARGTNLEGIELKDEYYKLDPDRAAVAMKQYLRSGGTLVFFDYSIEMADKLSNKIKFHNNFPAIGTSGTYSFNAYGSLKNYIADNSINAYFPHNAWYVCITPEKYRLLSGTVLSPMGNVNSTAAGIIPYGKGNIVFSSFHSDSETNNVIRFISTYAVSSKYRAKMKRYIKAWELKPVDFITESAPSKEKSRLHSFDISDNPATVFAFLSKGKWQIELFDSSKKLFYSKSAFPGVFKYDIPKELRKTKRIFIKIYPLDAVEHVIYGVSLGEGRRFFPYYLRIFIFIALLAIIIIYTKFIRKKRYTEKSFRSSEEIE